MQSWSPDLSAFSGPKYQAIASALARDIETGRLKVGDRLPPQRALAEALTVDLTTVTKAYNEVRRLGMIEGGGRRGSFVKGVPLSPFPELEVSIVDTGMNLPPEPALGSLATCMRDGFAALLNSPNILAKLQYQPSGGGLAEQATGAAFLRARGLDAPDDTVVVTSGSQAALHAIVCTNLQPGDAVGAGPYVYPGFLSVARRQGVEIVSLAVDAEGITGHSLDRACRERKIKAVYVVPTNDNPTAATMSEQRRREIVQVAAEHDLEIIEDDAYGLLPEKPLPPLACFAPERTWHVLSFSKIVSPSLRLAYLRAPSARQAWRIAGELHETSIMAPPLNAALLTRWIQDGSLNRLISETRGESIARQTLVRQTLGDTQYSYHPEGYHLWLPLPSGTSSSYLVNTLRPAGLSVVPSEAFAVDPSSATPALRISIGGSLSTERLARALRMLDSLLHQSSSRTSALV